MAGAPPEFASWKATRTFCQRVHVPRPGLGHGRVLGRLVAGPGMGPTDRVRHLDLGGALKGLRQHGATGLPRDERPAIAGSESGAEVGLDGLTSEAEGAAVVVSAVSGAG